MDWFSNGQQEQTAKKSEALYPLLPKTRMHRVTQIIGGLIMGTYLPAAPALAQTRAALTESKTFQVQTADGVTLSAQEWGNPNGLEVLLIHGFSQSHLSWSRQLGSELAKSYRIITYDIRGHGGSEKPLDAVYYQDHKRWADELKAVIETAQLKNPVLVGWSYGGRIIAE